MLDELILGRHICGSKHLSYVGKAFLTLILSCFWLCLRACTFHPPVPLPEASSVPSLCCLCLRGCRWLAACNVASVVGAATGVARLRALLLLLWSLGSCDPPLALHGLSTGLAAAATCRLHCCTGVIWGPGRTTARGTGFMGVTAAARGLGSCMQPPLLVGSVSGCHHCGLGHGSCYSSWGLRSPVSCTTAGEVGGAESWALWLFLQPLVSSISMLFETSGQGTTAPANGICLLDCHCWERGRELLPCLLEVQSTHLQKYRCMHLSGILVCCAGSLLLVNGCPTGCDLHGRDKGNSSLHHGTVR